MIILGITVIKLLCCFSKRIDKSIGRNGMDKPVLIIMAAGMGSRYGGLKQMDSIDEYGHLLMDYSVFDAKRAGFERVIIVIKRENEALFEERIGNRLRKYITIDYAHQVLENLPQGFSVPEGRTKPWGTAHAVLSAKDLVHGPFCVINADDYYGEHPFSSIYKFLTEDTTPNHHAMSGFRIENTLTENGYVSRGVCSMDGTNHMTGVKECLHIVPSEGGAIYTEGSVEQFIPNGTLVSMNFWGFQYSMMSEIEDRFSGYLTENLPINPLKCEYFLPLIPNALIQEGKASVTILPTDERWYGVTYHEDKDSVVEALKAMRESGKYPLTLWN